jgi:hypothetical protein
VTGSGVDLYAWFGYHLEFMISLPKDVPEEVLMWYGKRAHSLLMDRVEELKDTGRTRAGSLG